MILGPLDSLAYFSVPIEFVHLVKCPLRLSAFPTLLPTSEVLVLVAIRKKRSLEECPDEVYHHILVLSIDTVAAHLTQNEPLRISEASCN